MTSRWIIDSGAFNHICSSLSFFSSYTLLKKNVLVELPDGSHASVTHIGIVKFNSSFVLKDVYYIPSFKFNLLSISQLTSQLNCDTIFSNSICLFQDRITKTMIGRGRLQNGLYCLDDVPNSNFALSFQHLYNFDLWHSRLGHPCNSHFHFLIKYFKNVYGNKNFICDICPQAKQSRQSFPLSITRSSKNLSCYILIFGDLSPFPHTMDLVFSSQLLMISPDVHGFT